MRVIIQGRLEVFPARAGMIPVVYFPVAIPYGIPRESGDDPNPVTPEEKP